MRSNPPPRGRREGPKPFPQFRGKGNLTQQICGRRNLDGYQRTKLALRLEETIKERAKAHQSLSEGRGQKGSQKSADLITPIETREEIAKLAGVSRDTVDKVKQIEKSATPDIKAALARRTSAHF